MIDNIIHTEKDILEQVDYKKVNEATKLLEDLIKNYKVREVNKYEKKKNIFLNFLRIFAALPAGNYSRGNTCYRN